MIIKTLNVPGAIALRSVVAKIRKRCECGSDPDGYFTYTEQEVERPWECKEDPIRSVLNPTKKFIEKIPSQYFLGEGDIKILKGFFTSETGCRNPHEESDRRKFWWHTVESELFAECELTAPITFWAVNPFSKLFITNPDPIWDLSKYGEVSAAEFLDGMTISGTSVFNYHQLSIWWRGTDETSRPLLRDVLIPWIEQLPYADIFICNEDFYVKTLDSHCYGG